MLRWILLLLLCVASSLQARVNHDGDFQYWHYLSVDKALKDEWSTRLIGVMRWGDDASTFYFGYGQWQVLYTKKYFEVAPGYRQEFIKPNVEWLTRYNPMVDVTFFLPGKWAWEDRSRLIYHVPEHIPATWIYRNRLRLTTPQVARLFKMRFFIDDEIFFHERIGCSQNRVSIGLFGEPTSFLKGRLYYMYRNLKQEHWTHQHVVAFHLYF